MKVAILSAVPTCGKTTLMELLAGVFTISQRRTAAIFSTGDMTDLVRSVETHDSEMKQKPDIVRAMIENNPGDKLLLDYGSRIGMENVFMYDILSAEMDDEDKAEFMIKAINAVPVDLTLVEFDGSMDRWLNQKIFTHMNCSLFLVYPSWKSMLNYSVIMENLPNCPAKINYKMIASMIDSRSIGDKKFASMIGQKIESLIRFPEKDLLQKEALSAHLDACCQKIVDGDPQYVDLRIPMLEMMQYIYDQPNSKVIKEIDRWYK